MSRIVNPGCYLVDKNAPGSVCTIVVFSTVNIFEKKKFHRQNTHMLEFLGNFNSDILCVNFKIGVYSRGDFCFS